MISLIQDLQSVDNARIKQAQLALQSYQVSNISGFCTECCTILKDPQYSVGSRQLTGTLLRRTILQNINSIMGWDHLAKDLKQKIKVVLLQLLIATDKPVRRTAADNISAICAVQLPRNEWPDIIHNLVNNTSNTDLVIKESAITTLGFICELMKERTFVNDAGLEAIFGGILVGLTDKDSNIKQISLNAMMNSLASGKKLFDEQKVREFTLNQISVLITNETQEKTKVMALQTLAEFCKVIYLNMKMYVDALLTLTLPLMNDFSSPQICSGAMEIWSSFIQQYLELQSTGVSVQNHINLEVAKQLAEVFMKNMCVVTEQDQDQQETSVRGTAYRALCNLGQTNANDFFQLVMNFVTSTIASSQWSQRQASIKAFTCLLEGYDRERLRNLISSALIEFLRLLQDNSQMVQLNAAFSLSKITESVPESFIGHNEFQTILNILSGCLSKKTQISKLICQIFINLAEFPGSKESPTMNNTLDTIIDALFKNGMRSDVSDGSLPCISFLAAMLLVNRVRNDSVSTKYIHLILDNFWSTFDITAQSRRSAIQTGLLTVLQSCIIGVSGTQVNIQLVDRVFKFIEAYFQKIQDVDANGVFILAELTSVIPNTSPYLESVWKYVMHALKKPQDTQLFKATMILIADLARFDPVRFAPNVVIIQDLLKLFLEPSFNNECKLHITATIGDIFLACTPNAEQYLNKVLETYQVALQGVMFLLKSMFEYADTLRQNLIQSITSIMHATNSREKQNPIFVKYIPIFVQFIKLNTTQQAKPSIDFIRSSTLLCLDFIQLFQRQVDSLFKDRYLLDTLEILKKHNQQGEHKDVIDFASIVLKI